MEPSFNIGLKISTKKIFYFEVIGILNIKKKKTQHHLTRN